MKHAAHSFGCECRECWRKAFEPDDDDGTRFFEGAMVTLGLTLWIGVAVILLLWICGVLPGGA